MDRTIEQYGAGAGLVFGAGIGGVIGILAGPDASMALIAGFGAGGGLAVGALAGQFLATRVGRANWVSAVTAFTLGVSLVIGTLLGITGAWMVDGDLVTGVLVGGISGAVFGILVATTLVRAGSEFDSPDSLGLNR